MKFLLKLRQRLCKHKHSSWYITVDGTKFKFQPLNGQRNCLICDKCGKILFSYLKED